MPDGRRTACREPYIPVGLLDQKVGDAVAALKPPPDLRARLVASLQRMKDEHLAKRQREEQGLLTQVAAVDAKLVRLTDGFASGVIPQEQYRTLRAAYQAELDTARGRLAYLTAEIDADVDGLIALLDRADGLGLLYRAAVTEQDRKLLLNQVFKRIIVRNRDVVRMEYNPPFDLFFGDTQRCSEDVVEGALLEQLGHTGDPPSLSP
jgi:hypothetical protein